MATQSKKTAKVSRRLIFPVQILRTQVSALEAAIAQVLSRPKVEPVHRLRISTRRIEAQLEVIDALSRQEPGFAAALKPAGRARKLVAAVRRAAGSVRDLDVQRRLSKEVASSGATRSIRDQAKDLRRELKHDRVLEAQELVKMLERHALELEPGLEQLLAALEPVSSVGLSVVDLEVIVSDWYGRRRRKAQRKPQRSDQMHGARKAAKLARYMADGLPARVVEVYEAVQDTGGRWHDTLTLRKTARERVGKQSPLVRLLSQHEQDTKGRFLQLLTEL